MKKYNHKKIQAFSSLILSFISIFCLSQTSAPKFHDTKGNIEVTGAGQLQYTLPIDLPPGIKNVAPNISLLYTSGATNGLAGYSWNISGINAISRVGKNLEKDGITKGVQLDYSDYYSFNGQRLILKSGEYGKDGAEYVTEKYSNVKIKSVGSITGQSWQGPEYWEVTSPDGSQVWYGASALGNSSARTPIDYNIVKSKDTNGNYVTYNYTSEGNVSVISSIQWGGNEVKGTQHMNKIDFNFVVRPFQETAYIKGVLFTQSKQLESIVVSTLGKQYKKYKISYRNLPQNQYRYLEKITILNSNNEEANPVVFTYEESPFKSGRWSHSYTLRPNPDTDIVGDFDGDSNLDILRYHSQTSAKIPQVGLYLYSNYVDFYNLSGAYYNDGLPIFVGNSVSGVKDAVVVNLKKGNLVRNRQGFVLKKKMLNSSTIPSDLVLSFYGLTEDNQLVLDYTKTIPAADYDNTMGTISNGVQTTITGLKSVDFNGDSLGELVLVLNDKECHPTISFSTTARPPQECSSTKRYYVVDPDESIQGNGWYYPLELYADYDQIANDVFASYRAGDFNGDGVFDLLKLSQDQKPLLISFKKNAQGQYESFIAPFNPANDETIKGYWKDSLVGDYNGDGLSDLMMPGTPTSAIWYLYTSKGNGFKEETKVFYRPEPTRRITKDTYDHITVSNPRTFVAYDINNDGKTELVMLEGGRYYRKQDSQDSGQGVKYVRNYTATARVFSALSGELPLAAGGYGFPDEVVYLNGSNINPELTQTRRDVMGLSVDQWTGGMIRRFAMVSLQGETYGFGNEQDFASNPYIDATGEARIKRIVQGGVTTEVTYWKLNKADGIYDKAKTENYPYVEINQSYGMYVVSEMTQTQWKPEDPLSNVKLKQNFKYRGLTANILGKGMIGFRKMARSSWYSNAFENNTTNTIIWSGVEIDPVNDGIPMKEWTTKQYAAIFPDDLSENNTQLISLKTNIYQTVKLLNGQVVNTVSDADKQKIVTAILPARSRTKDFLTGTVAENNIIYGQYYLPTLSISKVNDSYGITTSGFEYEHNPSGTGSAYYIGRLKSKTETIQAYGDTKSAKEEYTYDNNRLKTLKKWNGNNTGYIMETYTHDGFGNITGKTLSNSIDAQTQNMKFQYDPTGRFVTNKTDNLGLETGITYNAWGQVLTQADPLGNTLENNYDNWGKLMVSTNSIQGKTIYNYERDTKDNVTVTKTSPEGNVSKTFTNKLGQVYKTTTKAFAQGQFVSKEIQYDVLGRKIKESEPYFDGQTANKWNTITYDDSVYPAKVKATAFTGKQTETTISGLTTTVKETHTDDYGRTTIKTADALGNTTSSTDKGGTVKFSYNAAGQQLKAQYAENAVTTVYDVWGRKSEFNDPSNGMYKYEYDGLGQLKKVISPKGTKEYTYNNLGQLISQKELSTNDGGAATNKDISFTYDDKGLPIKKTGTVNGQVYNIGYTYYPNGSIESSTEDSNGKTYAQKGISYDDKGRIISYVKQLSSSGIVTEASIENVYNDWNGELYQVKDSKSDKVLWELLETNAKAQVLGERLGSASIINTYNDTTGMLSEIKHSSSQQQSILNIQYGFNAIRNELKSRKTLGDFNIIESFNYDDNNRLLNWTNPITGQLSKNGYDEKGRIRENDQIGEIKFDNSSKIYQPTGMSLNNNGVQNYTGDLIQTVVYNENNDPVQIQGEKAQINFGYGLGNMRQRVDIAEQTGNIDKPQWENRFSKFYNEDGSFEIVKNSATGQEKHIIYIEGTPYESNIVYLKGFEQNGGSYKFLHKDYLGSILAITDQDGKRLEQRHYDAWGNLTHLKIDDEAVLTDKSLIAGTSLLIDRGYTGHEHFMKVGIIHMNGRLYDPLLRRFLNADENIQDPANTQNYNKYGYVMNNPLMYNDPNGEFWMWFAGALAGGYLNGVAANGGNWNPGKWDWQKSWSAVLGGAIGGAAISGTLGNIASNPGAIKFVLPSIVSGGLNSAFTGGNFLGGAIGGLSYSGNLSGNSITSTDGISKAYKYIISPDYSYNEEEDNWIAPFGKKFKTIENVLKGDKFESYEANGNVCFRAAKAQTINGGGNPSGPLQALQTFIDNPYQAKHGGDQLQLSYVAAIKTLMNELNNSRPITIGVTYARNEVGNHNRITDHFITVVGMGYDYNVNRNFFSFYDNVGNTTNLQINRLYVYPNRTVTGQGYGNNTYYMTEVRPNMPKPNLFNSNNIYYYKQYP